jgi:hypothetical protein
VGDSHTAGPSSLLYYSSLVTPLFKKFRVGEREGEIFSCLRIKEGGISTDQEPEMGWKRLEIEEDEEDDESFSRRYCIYAEDRLARTGEMRTGLNGRRWSRSGNIVQIEQARARRKARIR